MIGVVTAGWQTGARSWAAPTRVITGRKVAIKTTGTEMKRKAMADPRFDFD
jgi:hypothetical protein